MNAPRSPPLFRRRRLTLSSLPLDCAAKKWERPRVKTPKPSVPKVSEKPIMGLKTSKNFVVSNAVENILAQSKKPAAAPVNYMKKADYGKVPAYLKNVKEDIEDEMRVIEEYFSEHKEEPQEEGKLLSNEERRELIEKLKRKWDETNKKYQRIAHIVKLDTIGKVRRKESLEKELDRLVKDIQLLSQRRPIRIV